MCKKPKMQLVKQEKKTHRNQETTTCELADYDMDKATSLYEETLFQGENFPS
jgi:hypothetical protein